MAGWGDGLPITHAGSPSRALGLKTQLPKIRLDSLAMVALEFDLAPLDRAAGGAASLECLGMLPHICVGRQLVDHDNVASATALTAQLDNATRLSRSLLLERIRWSRR